MPPRLARLRGPVHVRPAGRLLAPLVLTLLASLLAGSTTTAAAPAEARSGHGGGAGVWFTSWAASQQGLAGSRLTDQSVRMISHLSQGGDRLRIRVQNTFGQGPLTIGAATVAHSNGRDAAVEGSPVPVTFDGRREVVVPAGGEVWSDPAALATEAQDDVAVSGDTR